VLRSDLAHDSHQNSSFLFRLRQLRNHRGNFIEYLVPALHLTGIEHEAIDGAYDVASR
jgi:hypothetical protein